MVSWPEEGWGVLGQKGGFGQKSWFLARKGGIGRKRMSLLEGKKHTLTDRKKEGEKVSGGRGRPWVEERVQKNMAENAEVKVPQDIGRKIERE